MGLVLWNWLKTSDKKQQELDLGIDPGEFCEPVRTDQYRLETLEPRLLLSADPVSAEIIRVIDSEEDDQSQDVAAIVQEEAFDWLDAPIKRVNAPDTPVPFSPPLENRFIPDNKRIEQAIRDIV